LERKKTKNQKTDEITITQKCKWDVNTSREKKTIRIPFFLSLSKSEAEKKEKGWIIFVEQEEKEEESKEREGGPCVAVCFLHRYP
jgi:hypothetical protein